LLVQCSQLREAISGLRNAAHTIHEVKTIS